MPPRHGKTELASRVFPAWILGDEPDAQIIATSYSGALASSINWDVQKIMHTPEYREIFPESSLSFARNTTGLDAKRNSELFEIVNHRGYYFSAGMLGSIVGRGADYIIIDDPIKSNIEAESLTHRNKIADFFRSSLYSRLEDNGKILLILTRWHEDDPAGRLLKEAEAGGEKWYVLKLTGIKKAADGIPVEIDSRKIGEALWPEKYDAADHARIARVLGSRYYSALYDQEPTAEEGNILKRAWFSEYDLNPDDRAGVDFYIDTAYTEKEHNDRTSILAHRYRDGSPFLELVNHEAVHKEFSECCEEIVRQVQLFGTPASRVIIEPKASGKSIAQYLKKNTRLNIIEDKPPVDSKETRLKGVAPYIQAGRVKVPRGAGWVKDFLDNVCGFPHKKFDDEVDTLIGAITQKLGSYSFDMGGISDIGQMGRTSANPVAGILTEREVAVTPEGYRKLADPWSKKKK